MVKSPGDPSLSAEHQDGEDAIDAFEDVCIRQERECRIALAERMYLQDRPADVDHVLVRQLDTLWIAGRAGRVHDGADVIWLNASQPRVALGQLSRRLGYPPGHFGVDESAGPSLTPGP